jgi:hypothetical protein
MGAGDSVSARASSMPSPFMIANTRVFGPIRGLQRLECFESRLQDS